MNATDATSSLTRAALRRWFFAALVHCVTLVASAAEATPRDFDVPAGEATVTLKQFAQQAGREILFPTEPVSGVQTNEVKGRLLVPVALQRLVAGTELRAIEDKETGAITITRAPAKPGAASIAPTSRELPVVGLGAVEGALVFGDNGRPAEGVVVTVEEMGRATQTDRWGRYALGQLRAGTYALAATGAGFGRLRITGVVVQPNSTLTLSAQRMPTGGADAGAAELVVDAASIEVIQLGAYEVAVTVQKRPQAAQSVPIALTSLSAPSLERYRVDNLQDLSRMVPNLLVSAFNNISPTIAIRGATNTFTQIGVNKPVAVVIDDVFIPRNSAATFELFDLDSVQVLRGPQGTLFGRNVTGGAIVLNTRQPSFSGVEGEIQTSFGNFGARRWQGMWTGPLTDRVAAKVALFSHQHDGYGFDRITGREQDDQDSTGVRGQVMAMLSPEVKASLSLDYSDDRNGGRTLSSKGVGSDGNRRTSELNYPQSYARTMWGVTGRIDWSTAMGDFASISAFRESRSAEDYSGTGTSYEFLTGGSQATSRDLDHPGTFTQELRYASPRWAWGDFVSGVYYLYEDGYRRLSNRSFAARTGALVAYQVAAQEVKTGSHAGYLDGTIHLARTLDLTLGGRYTVDRKEAALTRTDALNAANSFSARGLRRRWSEFTPRAVLAWEPRVGLKAYGSVTQGFTAGGFNTDASSLVALTTPFDPETVTNLELGLKTQLLANRLRVNLALFHERYSDKQELYFNTVTRILNIVNASEATMKGLELEVAYTPVQGLNLSASYGRLDSIYDEFFVANVLDNTGHPLGSAPKHKFSAGIDYEFPVSDHGYLQAAAAYAWTDDYYTGATMDPNLFVPAYSLVNASVGFQTTDRKWKITFWGKNLADTEYLLTPSTQGVLAEYLGAPRTYGITLGRRF